MKRGELVFLCVFFLVGLFAVIHAFSLPEMGPIPLSPGIFPMIVGFLLMLFSVVSGLRLVQSSVNREALAGGNTADGQAAAVKGDAVGGKPRSILLILLILAAYAGLLPVIHFIPASLLFACAAMFFSRRKFSVSILIVAVCAVAVIYLLFSFAFNVRLP